MLPPLLTGPALAAAGWSILDSPGIGFVQHKGSFWQLLTKPTPVFPLLLPNTCHTNQMHNVGIQLIFGLEEDNSFAAGYLGRLSLHEQRRHDLCRSSTGIIHAHFISFLPSLFWCLLRLQHFILPCASEYNIFIFSKALIYPKLSWIALLCDREFIAIQTKQGRGLRVTCLSYRSDTQGGPWGQRKTCRYLQDLEWLEKEQGK